MIQPAYAGNFACIGRACEDTCCNGWLVSVDEAAYQKYIGLPDSPLRTLAASSIQRNIRPHGDSAIPFATVRMLHSGACPFLSSERLCRIQLEHGESYLCRTCAEFPRTIHVIDGLKETELSLSCPEAARMVLLSAGLIAPPDAPGYQLTWDETAASGTALRPWFWPIRAFALGLILNHDYPLWQRMFLLGSFCRRLETLSRAEVSRNFPEILDDFTRAIAARGLSTSIENIPADLSLQLEIVLTIIAEHVNNVVIGPRLRVVLGAFIEGVGHTRTASLESQVARYADAYARYYVPFFTRRPQILENYLVNTILRDVFPFGKKLNVPDAEPEPAKAFAMLAIQFTLIKGLLIGVAGARGRRFNAADVVRTVQTAFKHFEHNPLFLSGAYTMLSARGLADARGLTMLLRN